jgi:hypothetical protein
MLPAGLALLLDLLQALREHTHALPDQAPVGLELRLARAAHADAALLALEVRPTAHQAARDVFQLRELHFELALEAAGALRKDVEDQAVAIEYAPADVSFFEIALLAGRERVIDENDVGEALASAMARTSSALPLPIKKRGSGRSRRPVTVATGWAPARAPAA